MSDNIDIHPRRKPPTPEQIIAEQKRRATASKVAARSHQAPPQAPKAAPANATPPVPNVPAVAKAGMLATTALDTRTAEQRYVDEISPSMIAGEMVKFSKDGTFVIAETEEEISPDIDFIALCDETLIGWIRFHDDGEPPDRIQGLLYDGFVMPARNTLGDMDESQWKPGLSGNPEDPFKHQICLVLQNPATQGLYTFVTTSVTGRRAVGNLLRHFDRMARRDPDSYPVVRLRPGGYHHKDERIGWVATPSFPVVGHVPKNSAAIPDSSPSSDMSDEIPTFGA